MNYPLISEYVEAIRLAEENLEQLNHLRPVLDSDGNPVMSSGNFAVVFKMRSEQDGKCYALKCFIKDQPGRNESYRLIADELEFVSSDFLVPIKFCDKELFVDTDACSETEFPVVVMDWVEGITLDRYVRQNLHNQYALQMLTYQFCRMASWLMSQPFAHGDLKPDNILVRGDGSLVLVDYDGMYVPAMQGQKACELGSPDYRHPARTEEDFNEHIDDFSLATIAMQLCAISLDPSLLPDGQGDTLLLTESDNRNLPNSDIHAHLHPLLSNPDFERLYALYHLAHAQQTLSNTSFRTFLISKPQKNAELHNISTKVTAEDLENGVRDEFGALYSPDGLRLLKGANVAHYHIRQGTRVICDSAFYWSDNLSFITIPDSVTHIGDWAFDGCESLSSITIPDSVTHIGANPFVNSGIQRIECNSPLFRVDEHALYTKDNKTIKALFIQPIQLFFDKSSSDFNIPNTVTHIGDSAFADCKSLSSIIIPDSVTHIGDRAFSWCVRLSSITIPDSVTHIGDSAFSWCESLSSITIPDSVTHIGNRAFWWCKSLTSINIPDSVTHIGDRAFCGCNRLSSITIPDSVTHIGANPFAGSGVSKIECYNSAFEADEHALYTKGKKTLISFFNKSAPRFFIPDSV
ncbi:MAG: leucine-rich repeat protein, partial [Muribaculaceae bacterium]|nr:leucine-rich repeat protein [Muribaculaceae bacterium]